MNKIYVHERTIVPTINERWHTRTVTTWQVGGGTDDIEVLSLVA
ncbi:hypothetical protein [Aquibacillus salsiterrae]|nr:hypothetical protein [Aquibacillus salsiterrae]